MAQCGSGSRWNQGGYSSPEDLLITRQLIQAGQILKIGVLDHVNLGATGQYRSLKDAGLVEFTA
ncbi:MAG: JAB domain-containing protein [bacterium]